MNQKECIQIANKCKEKKLLLFYGYCHKFQLLSVIVMLCYIYYDDDNAKLTIYRGHFNKATKIWTKKCSQWRTYALTINPWISGQHLLEFNVLQQADCGGFAIGIISQNNTQCIRSYQLWTDIRSDRGFTTRYHYEHRVNMIRQYQHTFVHHYEYECWLRYNIKMIYNNNKNCVQYLINDELITFDDFDACLVTNGEYNAWVEMDGDNCTALQILFCG